MADACLDDLHAGFVEPLLNVMPQLLADARRIAPERHLVIVTTVVGMAARQVPQRGLALHGDVVLVSSTSNTASAVFTTRHTTTAEISMGFPSLSFTFGWPPCGLGLLHAMLPWPSLTAGIVVDPVSKLRMRRLIFRFEKNGFTQ